MAESTPCYVTPKAPASSRFSKNKVVLAVGLCRGADNTRAETRSEEYESYRSFDLQTPARRSSNLLAKTSSVTLTFLCLSLLALLPVTGCAVYQARALTSSAVEKALTIPSGEVLQQDARQLKHPILRPLELDPRQPLSPEAAAVLAVLINPVLRAERDRAGVSEA